METPGPAYRKAPTSVGAFLLRLSSVVFQDGVLTRVEVDGVSVVPDEVRHRREFSIGEICTFKVCVLEGAVTKNYPVEYCIRKVTFFKVYGL